MNILKMLSVILVVWVWLTTPPMDGQVPTHTDEGFRVPQPGHRLTFPRDHGSHPDYKIEWWYLTGHLENQAGRPFGFQAAFFRFAGPLDFSLPKHPQFGYSHLFSTQVALTDIESDTFFFDERLDRNGWDAFANTETLQLRHGPWTLNLMDAVKETMELNYHIADKARLNLALSPSKPKVIFGPDGTSRKGADPTARSYYITFPHLSVSGKLVLDGTEHSVTGSAWMDHEIASQQLSDNLAGWDWTAIQLNDGRQIKAYLLRQENGLPSPFSQLIWIDGNSQPSYQKYGEEGFYWKKVDYWKSPHSDTEYPTTVEIETIDPQSGSKRTFLLKPAIDDQEIRGSLNKTHYWEGACTVENETGQLVGKAYLELAGYANDLSDALR